MADPLIRKKKHWSARSDGKIDLAMVLFYGKICTMSFLLNDNITGIVSLQTTKIHPTSGTFVQFSNADDSTTYAVKFVSPGDTLLDFGSTQGFAAAMAVALG